MFDSNDVICTDIRTASLELLSPEEILRMSVVRINTAVVFDSEGPRKGGLHDAAMGPLDQRQPCQTCGARRDCTGHIGHIELPLPALHPTLLTSLIRLLKTVCFRCKRLRLDPASASLFLRRFQLVQFEMLNELELFEQLKTKKKDSGALDPAGGNIEKRAQLLQLFRKLQVKRQEHSKQGGDLAKDISATHNAVETWSKLRSEFFRVAMSCTSCAHCGRPAKAVLKAAPYNGAIEVSWPWGAEKPFGKETFATSGERDCDFEKFLNEESDDPESSNPSNVKRGNRKKIMNSATLHAFQLKALMKALWDSPDNILLLFLFPATLRTGPDIFFLYRIPVSANKFRPLMKASFGGGGGGTDNALSSDGMLHGRTSALLDILRVVEKMSFALGVLNHPESQKVLEDPRLLASSENEKVVNKNSAPFILDIAGIGTIEKEKVRKIIAKGTGASKLLGGYASELQTVINTMIDSTKSAAGRNARVPPGVRQWMEKKQGAIRQKMMGKRVNYAARTVIAPDNSINTNEIGIPVEFARKLTIAEYVTEHSASYLARLVKNGPHEYPGANSVQDGNGRTFELAVLSQRERQAWARRITAAGSLLAQRRQEAQGQPPIIVYRHVRDGDVVIMNRQPTLHRASMMAHFVRVLRGWKTFRMMYVNCGSYNADFDGDEMNMHLPQDPCSRAEAQHIVNADCHYITAKNAEPLRGLIQDHVLGGAFLTWRGTFLNVQQYNTLLYVGLADFVDRGRKIHLSTGLQRGGAASNVARTAGDGKSGDPYFRVIMSRENLSIVTEPPTIIKPQKLWTGKQVINSILKTIVDRLALARFGNTEGGEKFRKEYRGFNFQGKSKTPGDAWGGVLDGDKEESTIVIRDSELLQGVFDKSMFGASSYGLVHMCFELLGPRAAGILLSVFAKTFTCFLQMRGFSCCTGDFLMTPEGERNREKMILRCTFAGNYLQEVFVDAIGRTLKWNGAGDGANDRARLTQYQDAVLQGTENAPLASLLASTLEKAQSSLLGVNAQAIETGVNATLDLKRATVELATDDDIPELYIRTDGTHEDLKNSGKTQNDLIKEIVKTEDTSSLKKSAASLSLTKLETFSELDLARIFGVLAQKPDWRSRSEAELVELIAGPVKQLKRMGEENKRIQRQILRQLASVPNLAIHFPRTASLLGNAALWDGTSRLEARRKLALNPKSTPLRSFGNYIGPPAPNEVITLPSGHAILGDGSFRTPVVRDPSWLLDLTTPDQENNKISDFHDTTRYGLKIAEVTSLSQLENYYASRGAQPFSLRPNEMTRNRLEQLCRERFSGREDILIKMADTFFQSGMGKITSKNNDLVSGDVTLYPFPQNGFASMITTGAKGSKVNFAMICGMLSQQSLEGKRVPVMVSGKTLPSFARFDLGARAGGLITDRYLTGLRPQEYFFHCMAGREGLVDTAVKTARSGYLQRCVMKGMEGIMVHYDGTVRDSDGTVIQFLYGEDGVDVAKNSFSGKLEELLQNPTIVRAKYLSKQKRTNPAIRSSLEQVNALLTERKKGSMAAAECSSALAIDKFTDPLSHVLPPMAHTGSVSDAYLKSVDAVIAQDKYNYVSTTASDTDYTNHGAAAKPTNKRVDGKRQEMQNLFLTRFTEILCAPGEAVGCLSAQSMGEPATQMTLNTFHLAGHGAANVTLGIPRLREILQTAGNAQTPFLYIPIRGDTRDEASRNAEQVLLGFKRIPLTDVIHGVGVESNVYFSPEGAKNSLPEYDLPLYTDNIDTLLHPKFFWEYETTIQFENLDHFCAVVPKFSPQKIVAMTISRCVREMLRQVSKLLYLYAYKYAEETLESGDDELQEAADRYIFERDLRTQQARMEKRRARARAAGCGFGGGGRGGGDAGGESNLDLMTSVDVAETYKPVTKGATDDTDGLKIKGESGDAEEEGQHADDEAEGDKGDELSAPSDEEKDDSESDFSASELGNDAREEDSDRDIDKYDAENEDVAFSGEERIDDKDEARRVKILAQREEKKRQRALESKWANCSLEFDKERRILKGDRLPVLEPDELEPEGQWSDTEGTKWKLKSLPEEAYRFLTGIKICRKTWRLVIKFGWPVKKCPRRVVFLDAFVKVLRKQMLQDTLGVRNPRIVGGDSAETGAAFEVQCQGSNFAWIHRLKDTCVNHNKVTTNDIRAILKYYGVEACRKTIIRELNKVFSVYGITVDFRHMNLIADAMTHSGFFRPFSRLGIAHHSSPFLQMSFETSMKFLTEAVERAATDDLRTPAGALVTGRPSLVGSGMCRVLPKLPDLNTKSRNINEPIAKAEEISPVTLTSPEVSQRFKSSRRNITESGAVVDTPRKRKRTVFQFNT